MVLTPAIAAAPSRLSRYLAGLPAGLDSYPEAQTKGSVYRNLLDDVPCHLAALPAPLRHHLQHPPIASEWLPEVHLWALAFAVADQQGMDEARLHAWAAERNRKLFEGSVYRTLMAMVSPSTLFRFCAVRWNAFHRGTSMQAGPVSDDGCQVTLAFPRAVFDEQVLRFLAVVFRTALEASRAVGPQVELVSSTDSSGFYRARWT